MQRSDKYFFRLVLLFILGITPALAGDYLSVDEAVELSLENSKELEIARLELENSRISYQRNKADIMRTESKSAELQNELSLMQAEDRFSRTRDQLAQDIISQYLQLLISGHDLVRLEKELELESRRLEETEKQVEMGHSSQMDLIQRQNSYNSAVFNYEESLEDYKEDQRELAYRLGLKELPPLNEELLQQIIEVEIHRDEFMEKALQASTEIKVQKKQVELAELQLSRAQEADTPPLELEERENDLEIARLNLEKAKKDTEHQNREIYNSFIRAGNSLDLALERLKEAEKNHEIVVRQKDMGLKTGRDLLSSEISFMSSEQSLFNALSSYYTSLLEVKKAMGLNVEEVAHDYF